jgi:ribose transport system permease protein
MISPVLQRTGTLLAFLVLVAGFSIAAPGAFASGANLLNLLQQVTTLSIVAVAATLVMVIGEFDLAIGFTASLAAVVAFVLLGDGTAIPLAILAALAAGVLAGLASGILVARFAVPSFVATLAVGTMVSGLAYWVSGGSSLFSGIPPAFTALARASLLGVPALVFWMVAVIAVAGVMLSRTRFGRRLHAIGDNVEAAVLAGLPVTRDRIAVFMLAGGLAALAGVLLAARLGSVQHTMGEALLLPAYAAVFVGTTAGRRGIPNIGGTFLGVAITGVIVNGLTILGAEPFVQKIVTGAIIVAAVLVRRLGARAR